MNKLSVEANREHKINSKFFIADLHHDIAEDLLVRSRNGEENILRRLWLPRFEKARIAIQIFPIYVDRIVLHRAIRIELRAINFLLEEIQKNSDKIEIALDLKQIQRIIRQNKIAAILALEGSEAIKSDFTLIELLYKLGIRIVSLTEVNKLLISKLHELRMLIDVTHLSEPDFWLVVRGCRYPVIASHSNARAVYDHSENLTDSQVRAIAKTGGVVGIGLHPTLVHDSNPTISRVVDHIDHIARLVGVDHIALGTDFSKDITGYEIKSVSSDSISQRHVRFSSIPKLGVLTELSNLFDELLRRGYNRAALYKLAAGNSIRVFHSYSELS